MTKILIATALAGTLAAAMPAFAQAQPAPTKPAPNYSHIVQSFSPYDGETFHDTSKFPLHRHTYRTSGKYVADWHTIRVNHN